MALLPGSPAIDAGDPGLAGATDQRGVLRPQGSGVDIGAFEYKAPTVSVVTMAGAEDNLLTLTAADFIAAFHVGDGNALVAVQIVAVPLAVSGSLELNGIAVSAGQVIAVADLDSLAFVPTRNFSGTVTFQFTASDGVLFAATPVTFTLHIRSAAQQAENLQAQVNSLLNTGVLNRGQANALIVKLNLKDKASDSGRIQAFLNQVTAYRNAGLLTQSQADELLAVGAILLVSVR
jgi:Cadherin-like domain